MSDTPCRVLIADDDKAFRDAVATFLRQKGFTVLCAGNARSAFSVGREHSLDVVVLDLGLPHLDLEWFIRFLREGAMTPDAHVVILTGAGAGRLELWTRSVGASFHLVKSTFSLSRLADMLRRLAGTAPPPVAGQWTEECLDSASVETR